MYLIDNGYTRHVLTAVVPGLVNPERACTLSIGAASPAVPAKSHFKYLDVGI